MARITTTFKIVGQSAHDQPALKDKCVLIVEDETDTREMLAQALKQRKAKPVQASSAKQALHLLKGERFDLIISDIGMPDVDGYRFMRKVRSRRSAVGKIPAIALTAY